MIHPFNVIDVLQRTVDLTSPLTWASRLRNGDNLLVISHFSCRDVIYYNIIYTKINKPAPETVISIVALSFSSEPTRKCKREAISNAVNQPQHLALQYHLCVMPHSRSLA